MRYTTRSTISSDGTGTRLETLDSIFCMRTSINTANCNASSTHSALILCPDVFTYHFRLTAGAFKDKASFVFSTKEKGRYDTFCDRNLRESTYTAELADSV